MIDVQEVFRVISPDLGTELQVLNVGNAGARVLVRIIGEDQSIETVLTSQVEVRALAEHLLKLAGDA